MCSRKQLVYANYLLIPKKHKGVQKCLQQADCKSEQGWKQIAELIAQFERSSDLSALLHPLTYPLYALYIQGLIKTLGKKDFGKRLGGGVRRGSPTILLQDLGPFLQALGFQGAGQEVRQTSWPCTRTVHNASGCLSGSEPSAPQNKEVVQWVAMPLPRLLTTQQQHTLPHPAPPQEGCKTMTVLICG